MRNDELPPLRDVIARHGLSARKGLGQHFLLDLNLCDKIARLTGDLTGINVIEVGPGPGGLTRSLLRAGAKSVIAIEKDDRCLAALEELTAVFPERLHIVAADATKIDPAALVPMPRRVIANLPYNVSTILLISWLRQATDFDSMTLMFQREVADRLMAGPGTKSYGRLSVIAQWLCEIEIEINVDKSAFTPPPKVSSTVLTLTPRETPLADAEFADVEAVTAAAFGQRRKMLRSSLRSFNLDLTALEIDPTARGETLTIEEFCRIARALAN